MRSNRNQRTPAARRLTRAERIGQLLDRRRAEERCQRQIFSKNRFDPREHPHREQRVSAEIEKVLGFRGRDELVHRDDLVLLKVVR